MPRKSGRIIAVSCIMISIGFLGCPPPVKQCAADSECPAGAYCKVDLKICVQTELQDRGASDASVRDAGRISTQIIPLLTPTCGSAIGDKIMTNNKYTIMGALCEPTPAAHGGTVEMHNSHYRCIGGFGATLGQ